MATYNGARYLAEQLESIAGQHRAPDLLVVSDDHSSDATWEIATTFARTAPFETRVLRGPGTGLADNFWNAVAHADTDLIAWSDQDDIWLPGKLDHCEREFADDRVDLVSHSADTVSARGEPLGRRYPDYRARSVRPPLSGDPWHVPSGFATVFRRRMVEHIPFDTRPRSHQIGRTMNHDHAVSLWAFATSFRVELPEALARYRQHDTNAAGDPTVYGASRLRATLAPATKEFELLADIAREQGAWLRSATPSVAIQDYFNQLAERCQARAHVFEGTGVASRLGRVGQAARRGVYRPRETGGFGRRGLARDLGLAVLAGRA